MAKSLPKVLFARIGWMKFYAGPQQGDEKPIGGGDYNSKGIGGEIFNFLNLRNNFYGYLQPHARFNDCPVEINLERIAPGNVKYTPKEFQDPEDRVDDVMVIFVAKSPKQGQVIVGWYKNATVYRGYKKLSRKVPKDFTAHWYNITAKAKDCVLLPTYLRTQAVPTGKKAMGQANAFYLYEGDYEPKDLTHRKAKWVHDALEYVGEYSGDNLVQDPDAEIQKTVSGIHEENVVAQTGQGFSITPELRRAIEVYSVNKAIKHFKNQGWSVKDVGNVRSYDLECSRKGRRLQVEVKGTVTAGKSIVLTENEVSQAKKNPTALFVLHSIMVTSKRSKHLLSGGTTFIRDPWLIDKHGTKRAIAYTYELTS